jgi:endonuclease/exonuclease/phosphatase family metal-dependent hydrolase
LNDRKPGLLATLFSHAAFLFNILAVLWMGLCGLASVINPAEVKYLSLFSLTLPFAILVNVFFIVLWLFSSRKLRMLMSLLVLLVCYKATISVFGFNYFGDNDVNKAGNCIKIMSWNSHGMGLHNRPRDKEFDENLVQFIKERDADILCLMEYPTPRNDFMNKVTQRIIQNGNYKDFRFKDDNILSKIVFLGTAVFSKYPLRNFVPHKLSENIYMLQADVDLPNSERMRMFFVHLNTFGLTDNDKAYIESVKAAGTVTDKDIDSSKSFMEKLDAGYVRRSVETDKAARIIAQSPYPVLVCGDMNDLPGSYTYTNMRGGLKDVFLEKGKGLGRTYNQISPTLRIDHMFYDPAVLKPVGFACIKTHLSDHNPLITNFEIIPKAR